MFLYCSSPCIIHLAHLRLKCLSEGSRHTGIPQGWRWYGGGLSQDAGNYTLANFVILDHSAILMTLPTFWPLSMTICNSDNLWYSFKLKSVGWPHSACMFGLNCTSYLSRTSVFFPVEMRMLVSSSGDCGKDFTTHCLLLAHTATHTEPQMYMEVML